MQTLRITLIQTNLHWVDITANLEMLGQKVACITEPTDLIVLPETFSTGFSMEPGKYAEDAAHSRAINWMRTVAKQKECVITGSLMLQEDGQFFNRLIWMQPDGTFQYYNKRHLFALAHEDKAFTGGHEKLTVELKGWKIRPLICYDLRFPVWSKNLLDKDGNPEYDLLLYVANWPDKRSYAWKHLLIARAIENQAFVVGLNRVGNDGNDNYYSGDSMVVGPLGQVLYHKVQEEDIFTVELEYGQLETLRNTFPFLKDADSFTLNKRQKIAGH